MEVPGIPTSPYTRALRIRRGQVLFGLFLRRHPNPALDWTLSYFALNSHNYCVFGKRRLSCTDGGRQRHTLSTEKVLLSSSDFQIKGIPKIPKPEFDLLTQTTDHISNFNLYILSTQSNYSRMSLHVSPAVTTPPPQSSGPSS